MITSLKVPYMRPFATDENGEFIKMTFKEAGNFCAEQGKILPTALDFMLVSRLSGAEIKFLDIWEENVLQRKSDDFWNFEGVVLASHDYGRAAPAGIEPPSYNASLRQQKPQKFAYRFPENYEQKISSYHRATFWSRTLVGNDTRTVHTYQGSTGQFRRADISGFNPGPKSWNFEKRAVVCSSPRE